jgi:hypothetical protein
VGPGLASACFCCAGRGSTAPNSKSFGGSGSGTLNGTIRSLRSQILSGHAMSVGTSRSPGVSGRLSGPAQLAPGPEQDPGSSRISPRASGGAGAALLKRTSVEPASGVSDDMPPEQLPGTVGWGTSQAPL